MIIKKCELCDSDVELRTIYSQANERTVCPDCLLGFNGSIESVSEVQRPYPAIIISQAADYPHSPIMSIRLEFKTTEEAREASNKLREILEIAKKDILITELF